MERDSCVMARAQIIFFHDDDNGDNDVRVIVGGVELDVTLMSE